MSGPRWLVPEVVQTSAMDCGPASLTCLLEGFGIRVSYGRLREACQTGVDGTSIDTLEEVARALGLEAEQIMLPVDHVLERAANALPALVVVRQPNGNTHFVVAWRQVAGRVQVMDPATGRRWLGRRAFLDMLHVHAQPVPASGWREWAGSGDFLAVLRRRLAGTGVSEATAGELVGQAVADPAWRSLAALDAATRTAAAISRAAGLGRGPAERVLRELVRRASVTDDAQALAAVPPGFWSVRPAPPGEGGEEQLHLRGAVLVRVAGRRARAASPGPGRDRDPDRDPAPAAPAALSPELAEALRESPPRPGRELLRLLRADGLTRPAVLCLASAAAAGAALVEALLFRGLFDLGALLGLRSQRLGVAGAILIFLVALALLELPIASGVLAAGRALEGRLRLAFLRKIPRLYDRYLQSRLVSDMAERCHALHAVRATPQLGSQVLRTTFELLVTTAGIVWLDPARAPLAAGAAAASVVLPLLFQPPLAERELQVRTHGGALSRFYLDALLGLVPIRCHGAAGAVREEHESLLVEWVRSGRRLLRTVVLAETAAALVGFALAALLVGDHLQKTGDSGGAALLLAYWALQLPVLGQELSLSVRQYPGQRNVLLRLLEPLGAPEAELPEARAIPPAPAVPATSPARAAGGASAPTAPAGVRIALRGVSVRIAGRALIEGAELAVAPGEHVAIVGPSGAGKSTLLGLLLGWHRAAGGAVEVDGEPLDAARLDRLRRETAWLDPAVQLWNRSMLANLLYGAPGADGAAAAPAIEAADLHEVLERLPDGLATPLGEGGALVSGGEGQRVRLGRALLRPGVRLALLDEPFRGLEPGRRRELLARARRRWDGATVLCVTHDVGETAAFPRVLVLDGGRLVEDGAPAELAARPESRYAALLDAERAARARFDGAGWRRATLDHGRLGESPAGGAGAASPGGPAPGGAGRVADG